MAQTLDVDRMKTVLEEKRRELMEGVVRARQGDEAGSDAGAPDIADRATSAFLRDFSYFVSENEAQILRYIDEALERIDNGMYGMCTSCGQHIEPPRLAAIPWARHCISCQELQDRGEL